MGGIAISRTVSEMRVRPPLAVVSVAGLVAALELARRGLAVPASHRLAAVEPAGTEVRETRGQLVLGRVQGAVQLTLTPR